MPLNPFLKGLSIWCKLYFALVLFSLAGSLLTRLTHANPGLIAPGTALLTLAIGMVTITRPFVARSLAWAVSGVFVLGVVVELVGVSTGYPFGPYAYTDAWWPILRLPSGQNFPLQVPFAWGLVTLGSLALVLRAGVGQARLPVALLTGLVAALVDLVMEPVITNTLGYWHWLAPGTLPGGAPITNFVGWWATAAIGAAFVRTSAGRTVETKEPILVLIAHVVLIVGIGLIGSPITT